jgi:hypothetical protein
MSSLNSRDDLDRLVALVEWVAWADGLVEKDEALLIRLNHQRQIQPAEQIVDACSRRLSSQLVLFFIRVRPRTRRVGSRPGAHA